MTLFQHKKALMPLDLFSLWESWDLGQGYPSPCGRVGSGLKHSDHKPFLSHVPSPYIPPARNGLVNKVEFLGLIPKKLCKDQ